MKITRYTARELAEALRQYGDLPVAVSIVDSEDQATSLVRELRLELNDGAVSITAYAREDDDDSPSSDEDAMWRIIAAADESEDFRIPIETIPDALVWKRGLRLGISRVYLKHQGNYVYLTLLGRQTLHK